MRIMKKQHTKNMLTNRMRPIVLGLISAQFGYCLLSALLTLMLTALMVGDSQAVEDPLASMVAQAIESEYPDIVPSEEPGAMEESTATPPASGVPATTEEPPEEIDIRPYQKAATFIVFLIYAFSVYQVGWQYGLRDRNVVKMGYAKRDAWRGLTAGLLAVIPSAVLLVLTWTIGPFQPWFKLSHYVYEWLFQLTRHHLASYALVLPMIPVLTHWGFHNGYADISIRRKLVYRKPKPKE